MDADCTYPAELIPELVKRLLDDDSISSPAIVSAWLKTAPCQAYTVGNWVLSFNARLLFGYGIKDSQSGMWVFRKSIFDNPKTSTNDGMPLSEEIKILAKAPWPKERHQSPFLTESVLVASNPHMGRWLKNLRFLYSKRFGLHRTRTMGPAKTIQTV